MTFHREMPEKKSYFSDAKNNPDLQVSLYRHI